MTTSTKELFFGWNLMICPLKTQQVCDPKYINFCIGAKFHTQIKWLVPMDYKSSLVSSKFQSGKCYISYFAIIQDLMFNCYESFNWMCVRYFCKSLDTSSSFRVRMNSHLDYWARKLHDQLEQNLYKCGGKPQGEGIPKLRGSGAGCSWFWPCGLYPS